jgi:outer membrane receptor protein involved in Fe transport
MDNITEINESTSLHSLIAFDSENSSRSQDYIQLHPKQWACPDDKVMAQLADPYSLRNRYFACSENEINLISIIQRKVTDNFSGALGLEYSYNWWAKSWFKPDNYIRLGDHWNILSDEKSPAYGWENYFGTDSLDTYFVGNGWNTNTISIFGEANYEPVKEVTLLLSGRLDKDSYSDLLFSPRFAAIWEFYEVNFLKFIAQRSLRMNTAEELLILDFENNKPRSERLDNIELIYTRMEKTNLIFNLSAFISWMDILSWNDPLRSTILSGKLNMWGIEFDTKYYTTNFDFIINHSFYKQISWKLEPGIYESGISYSDYYKEYFGAILTDTGNDLNNISRNTTKFAVNWKLFDNKLALHIDSRIYWDFKGAEDGMKMMKSAIPFCSDSVNVKGIIALIEKYDTYGPDARINGSLSYSITENLGFTIYGMNLINLTNNKRLRYDTGSKEEKYRYIMKNGLILEPLTIGMKFSYKY